MAIANIAAAMSVRKASGKYSLAASSKPRRRSGRVIGGRSMLWRVESPIRENQFRIAHVVIYETSVDDANDFVSTERCECFG